MANLDEISKDGFVSNWSFDEIESWLKEASISADDTKFISEKTELLNKRTNTL